jgi:hypothetical protein
MFRVSAVAARTATENSLATAGGTDFMFPVGAVAARTATAKPPVTAGGTDFMFQVGAVAARTATANPRLPQVVLTSSPECAPVTDAISPGGPNESQVRFSLAPRLQPDDSEFGLGMETV